MDHHDRFFKAVFGDTRTAAEHFAATLDQTIIGRVDWGRLRAIPTESVDERLGARRADLQFEVPVHTRAGTSRAFIQLLFEHQSTIDAGMPMRMLQYMVRAWEAWARDNEGDAYPIIVPIVLYNGRRPWTRGRHLADVFDGSGPIGRRYLPSLEILVQDVDELVQRPEYEGLPNLAAHALRLGTRPDLRLLDEFTAPLGDLNERPSDNRHLHVFGAALQYLVSVRKDTRPETVEKLVRPLKPRYRAMAMTYGEELIQKGFEQGIEQGFAAGETRAMERLAARLARRGIPVDVIAEETGLSVSRVLALAAGEDDGV